MAKKTFRLAAACAAAAPYFRGAAHALDMDHEMVDIESRTVAALDKALADHGITMIDLEKRCRGTAASLRNEVDRLRTVSAIEPQAALEHCTGGAPIVRALVQIERYLKAVEEYHKSMDRYTARHQPATEAKSKDHQIQ